MTQIPDSLKKLRDDTRNQDLHFRPECEGFRCGAHKSYNEGFEAACAELLPVIEEMREALRLIAEGARASITQRHMLGEVDNTFDFVVSKLEIDAIKALAAADKILGGK